MDWARRASPPGAHQHLAAWKLAAPQLDPFASPAEILDAVGRPGHPDQSCRLLSGLLLAAHHDALAVHAVLVALIPGLRVAAGRRWQTARGDGPWTSRDELDTDTISAAWQAIVAHAGERHPRPARLIIRAAERHLRTSHDAYHRRSARTLPQGNLNNATTMSLADLAGAEPLALALVESAKSGRLDLASFDIAYRVALLDEDPSSAGSRHGLDRRQTRATLRSALDALAGDHHGTSFLAPRSRSINPPTAQEVQPMTPPPQPFGASRDPDSGLPVVPLLLTVNQAAELLGMGRSTIYELIDSDELKSVKRGASRRVPLKAIHEYIEHLLTEHDDDSNRTPSPSASHRIVPIRE
jgi:excisionase family DNA binding protein